MKYYVVDAFADALFKGNPAGVCVLIDWPDDDTMRNIAAENNLSETAFIIKRENFYDLRWFTPKVEIDLCGHATLASAFIIDNFIEENAGVMNFNTKSGILTVKKDGDLYEMDFPSRKPAKIDVSSEMEMAVGAKVLEAHKSRDLLLVLESEYAVNTLEPDFSLVKKLDCFGVVVTAPGDTADFVSRYFVPGAGINEDPVTGSTHSSLIPFWAERLSKNKLSAKQLSERGGFLLCESLGERVKIKGGAILYLRGEIML